MAQMKIFLQKNAIPLKKSLTSILDNFRTCSKEESKEISERLTSLSEDDKKVARIEVIDL